MKNSTSNEDCLNERKWYIFLLSSLVTFFAGFLIIAVYRLILWVCCHRRKNIAQAKVANHTGPLPTPDKSKVSTASAPGGTLFLKSPDPEIGWMTEAKDWAGELISGQTMTGRILVSFHLHLYFLQCLQTQQPFHYILLVSCKIVHIARMWDRYLAKKLNIRILIPTRFSTETIMHVKKVIVSTDTSS